MFIELEFKNDDENTNPVATGGGAENPYLDTDHNDEKPTHDTNYLRLESSRKEERRPFSPPFKV